MMLKLCFFRFRLKLNEEIVAFYQGHYYSSNSIKFFFFTKTYLMFCCLKPSQTEMKDYVCVYIFYFLGDRLGFRGILNSAL